MSSGNPFRASQLFTTSSPIPQTSLLTPDSSVPEDRSRDGDYVLGDSVLPPPKTKKHVRIESSTTLIPPHPDAGDPSENLHDPLAQRLNQSQYADSPPPVASAGFSAIAVQAESSKTQDAGERDTMATLDVQPSSTPSLDKPQTPSSLSSAPANPFSRTLASLEPQEGNSREDRTSTEKTTPGNSRASLDVESFKNLLLTGKPTLRPSAQPPQTTVAPNPLSGAQFESSSSTDTSSISRQSLLEYPHEAHAETPRTSYEMADSDEDERMGLVSEVKKGKKKPPPAPKPRYGKPVTPRQPQIVPFDSFAVTRPTLSPITRSRDNSDVNKPLPPTPVVSPPPLHISTQDATSNQPAPVQQRTREPLAPSDVLTPQKKTPPPVPLARRQSQLRTSGVANRSRSSSSLTMSSQHSIDPPPTPVPTSQDQMAGAKSPPPPPRPRHAARLANISKSGANSSNTELPQRSPSMRTATLAPRPPSSRRSTLDSDFEPSSPLPGINRTSSMPSNCNTSRVVSNESTGSTMPPPPPPPRRQSNRSSLDQARPYIPSSSPTESRRTSTENRRTSAASESSLRHEYAPADAKGGNEYALYSPREEVDNKLDSVARLEDTRSDSTSILDDMDKFQREIDELRTRYKKNG